MIVCINFRQGGTEEILDSVRVTAAHEQMSEALQEALLKKLKNDWMVCAGDKITFDEVG